MPRLTRAGDGVSADRDAPRSAETASDQQSVATPSVSAAASPARAALAPPALLRLQATVGNAAVRSAVARTPARRAPASRSTAAKPPVQRLEGGACPPAVTPPAPAAPAQDPGFRAVTGKVANAKKAATSHPPAGKEANAAQAAAKAPADDKEAQAKAAQAEEMGATKPAAFDKAAFIAAVNAAVAAQAPKNLDEADKFASSGKADTIKNEVMGKVTQGKSDSAKPLADKTQETPDTAKAVEKPVTPIPPKPAQPLPPVDAAKAMPPKAPAEQTQLGAGKCETDQQMADAGVTEQQLAKSNEPEFTEAVAAKKAGEAHSAKAPAQLRQAEEQKLGEAKAGAQDSGAAAVAGMAAAKQQTQGKVAGQQSATQAKDEGKRAEVTADIKRIFDKTKTDVTKILTDLDGLVTTTFEEGEREAKAAFTADHKARMEKYKDARYSGVTGWARWTADLFTGLPAEANQLFQESRKLYEQRMQVVIARVADVVGRELTRAKDRIAAGRAEIAAYVKGLSPALQGVGREAANAIETQFEQLDASVDEKSQALVEDLASKYVEARDAVDDEIKAMQEENKGLWDKAKEAVGGAITTILKLKDMLLGVLSRAAGAVEKIIKDPIGFLSNFVNAVKTGVQNFAGNIVEHLKKGLQGWLFGALADAGIEIPEKFDLKGIVRLVLSLLGLTWNSIRARITKVIPEPVMQKIEQTVEVFKILVTEGVGGLWKWIVQKLSDLKEMVMSQIRDFVITKVITAGITWLISLLNPAAAFIKACKMIYDAVMWFIDNAERLRDFVSSVLDSVESIASGGVGKVAGLIEQTLAKAVPMVISGLASLLGLGGISEKIKKILETVQKPVGKIVDAVIKGGLKLASPIIKAMSKGAAWVKGKYEAGKKWVKGKYEAGKKWVKTKYEAGKKWVKDKFGAGKAWVKGKAEAGKQALKGLRDKLLGITFRESFQVDGESHSVFTRKGEPRVLYTASKPKRTTEATPEAEIAALDTQFNSLMSQYWDIASQMTGGPADAQLARRAGALKSQAETTLKKIVDLTRKHLSKDSPGRHAPNIGDKGPHRMQTSRLRPKDKGKEVPAWRMESEHLVPRELISAYFSVLPITGAAISDAEYDAMVTILMYANASKIKTTTAAVGDLASIRAMKRDVGDRMRKALRSGRPISGEVAQVREHVLRQLDSRGKNAFGRASAAVVTEQQAVGDARGKGAKPRPTEDEMRAAYNAQVEQILEFWSLRLARVEELREEEV